MISVKKWPKMFKNLGINTTIFSYLETWIECYLFMKQASKDTRDHLDMWKDEYVAALGENRMEIIIRRFDRDATLFLINNNLFNYLDLNVQMTTKNDFAEFLHFLEECEDKDKLRIKTLVWFHSLDTKNGFPIYRRFNQFRSRHMDSFKEVFFILEAALSSKILKSDKDFIKSK